MHYSFGVLDRPIYNSNQLLDEDLGTTWEGKKKGPVAPNIQYDKYNERERENEDGERTRLKNAAILSSAV